jgi:hypothetical protein
VLPRSPVVRVGDKISRRSNLFAIHAAAQRSVLGGATDRHSFRL